MITIVNSGYSKANAGMRRYVVHETGNHRPTHACEIAAFDLPYTEDPMVLLRAAADAVLEKRRIESILSLPLRQGEYPPA